MLPEREQAIEARMMFAKRRILFVSEAVTLAHMARPLVLARALSKEGYEVHFACPDSQALWLKGEEFRRWPINCISTDQFIGALERGAPPYTKNILRGYVEEDLSILDEVRPDLVVGDFRLSLTVSCPLRSVPYANVCNAYWSPYCSDLSYPLPNHPAIHLIGLAATSVLFRVMAPFFLRLHTRVYNGLRRAYGLPALGDLRNIYTYGDHVLYADIPSMVSMVDLPANHHFIGPVLWSPPVDFPEWWGEDGKRSIYVTLGSSGDVSLLDQILSALIDMPYEVMVATGSRVTPHIRAANIKVADYVPGVEAARRASLVICNGGSPTVYQALSQGKPILGIPSNMDQFLNMRGVEQARAGKLLRTQHAEPERIRKVVCELLESSVYRNSARRLGEEIASFPSGSMLVEFVAQWLV